MLTLYLTSQCDIYSYTQPAITPTHPVFQEDQAAAPRRLQRPLLQPAGAVDQPRERAGAA